MEEKKWIEGYEGLYQITSYGRVISADRYDKYNRHLGGEMKPQRTGAYRDYWFVPLYKDGKVKQHFIHRLVAKAFIPNPENKRCVDHIDNDKSNNHVENLRWVTHKENMNNTITRRRMKDESAKYISQAGADNPFSRRVAAYTLEGEFVGEYNSGGQAIEALGLPKNTDVGRVCRGERKHTHGYVFKYLGEAKRKMVRVNNSVKMRKPIQQLTLNGELVAEYESVTAAAKETGFLACNIGRVANKRWKSYMGFVWRYK